MSLLFNGEEVETFHLDDLYTVKKRYSLETLVIQGGDCEFSKASLIKYSKQLQLEGIGVITSTTSKLMKIMEKRKYEKLN